MELLAIGLRNLARNRRRTALNAAALAIGTAIMIVSLAWVRGYFTSFYDGIINLDTGHAQVLHRDYLDEQRRLPLDLAVTGYGELRGQLLQADAVLAASPRLQFSARVGDGRRATYMVGRGIDPEGEAGITVIDEHMEAGSYLAKDESGVLVSSRFASRLGVSPGEEIVIDVIDRDGVPRSTRATVSGTFRLGYPAIDEQVFYMDLASAQRLLRMDDAVTHLVLRLDAGARVEPLLETVRERVPALTNREELALREWRVFVGAIVSAVEADIAGFSIIIAVLYLLVIIGILNSMSMAVHERTKELGTLRAIGMTRRQVRRLLLAEGAGIALLGVVAGAALSALSSIYFGGIGFDLTALEGTGLPIPFAERFTADFRIPDYLLGAGIGLVTAIVGTMLPARRAARLPVAAALGSHLE